MHYVIYTRLSEETEEWDPIIDMRAAQLFKKQERKFEDMTKVNGAIKNMKLKEGFYKIVEKDD